MIIEEGKKPYKSDAQIQTLKNNLIRKYKFSSHRDYGSSILLLQGKQDGKTVMAEIFLGPDVIYKVETAPDTFAFTEFEGEEISTYRML
ncbi:MAG: hypothetical protein LIO77_08480 [Rikenellaceae bacterium]|nr:hypothetical protein [Rikenellaceae bacterium]